MIRPSILLLLHTKEPMRLICEGHLKSYYSRSLFFPRPSIPLLTDADFFLTELDQSLFPGVSSSIEVHDGFKDAQAKWVIRRGNESQRHSRTR